MTVHILAKIVRHSCRLTYQLSPNLGICVKQLEPSLDILSEPKDHVLASYKHLDSQRISGVVLILDTQHRWQGPDRYLTDKLVGLRLERGFRQQRIRIAAWSDGIFVSTNPPPRSFQKPEYHRRRSKVRKLCSLWTSRKMLHI